MTERSRSLSIEEEQELTRSNKKAKDSHNGALIDTNILPGSTSFARKFSFWEKLMGISRKLTPKLSPFRTIWTLTLNRIRKQRIFVMVWLQFVSLKKQSDALELLGQKHLLSRCSAKQWGLTSCMLSSWDFGNQQGELTWWILEGTSFFEVFTY